MLGFVRIFFGFGAATALWLQSLLQSSLNSWFHMFHGAGNHCKPQLPELCATVVWTSQGTKCQVCVETLDKCQAFQPHIVAYVYMFIFVYLYSTMYIAQRDAFKWNVMLCNVMWWYVMACHVMYVLYVCFVWPNSKYQVVPFDWSTGAAESFKAAGM